MSATPPPDVTDAGPAVDVRSLSGEVVGSADLDPAVFAITPNVAVMHQVVTAQLAAARSGTHSTKTRAEVAGGGRKPWRQKGSGRARQGSTRAPHWRGGGVAMGPKPRSYRQRTPKKMIQLALRSALSDRAAEGRVAVVDSWSFEVPRTKDAVEALAALGIEGRILVVLGLDDDVAYRSFRNLPDVQPILTSELNAYDVLCNDWVVFTTANLPGSARGWLEEGVPPGDAAVDQGREATPPMTAGGAPGDEIPPEADALPGDTPARSAPPADDVPPAGDGGGREAP